MNDTSGGPVKSPEDMGDLEAILNRLVDLPLLAVRTAYGQELRLDFGQSVPFRSPLLAGRVRGAWVLGTRASPWRVMRSNEFAADAQQDANEMDLAELVGATVTRARVSYPDLDLTLSFDGGTAFTVSVDRDENDHDENDHDENDHDESILSAWELFTPDRLVLTVGPGRRWSLTPVDSPTDATS